MDRESPELKHSSTEKFHQAPGESLGQRCKLEDSCISEILVLASQELGTDVGGVASKWWVPAAGYMRQ